MTQEEKNVIPVLSITPTFPESHGPDPSTVHI